MKEMLPNFQIFSQFWKIRNFWQNTSGTISGPLVLGYGFFNEKINRNYIFSYVENLKSFDPKLCQNVFKLCVLSDNHHYSGAQYGFNAFQVSRSQFNQGIRSRLIAKAKSTLNSKSKTGTYWNSGRGGVKIWLLFWLVLCLMMVFPGIMTVPCKKGDALLLFLTHVPN